MISSYRLPTFRGVVYIFVFGDPFLFYNQILAKWDCIVHLDAEGLKEESDIEVCRSFRGHVFSKLWMQREDI